MVGIKLMFVLLIKPHRGDQPVNTLVVKKHSRGMRRWY
jgi:hypothetical protein